jgi:hypothetical protein
MNSRRNSDSTITINRSFNSRRLTPLFKRILEILTHYDSK